ncbi:MULTISPECIES: DNA polymerase III subunit delta' [unclassified Pseudofrankia]|uniref:DNA polymerase III subunit delta' n=1 Tax=unclassified Pseudofrankia TaxID=2994372 RepID=UPI0008D9E8CB|nr:MULTISPECIES: DNA polymerase III subunit delta' [unclassified Pseudofrankia]MDT3441786.1 DNA polymerase III subunit delta' [Pseudofrankia sp. BMG5.37]OHV47077.1 DNA polymerase III subunit delta' [Pseudofrankia sp. BMG5.36]
MSVWESLTGQDAVVDTLSTAAKAAALIGGPDGAIAAARAGMTHSWLFTGPSGAGRVDAARTFAAALSCERASAARAAGAAGASGEPAGPPGCGECVGCHTVLTNTAADLRTVRAEGLSLGVQDVRALVRDAASAPTSGRYRILLIEEADRLTDSAANALLKALEEPAERSVFLLCAPSVDDVIPTIRSRCRVVALRLPSVDDIANALLRDGVDERTAQVAARASQGHLGRARLLAVDERARAGRAQVLAVPGRLGRAADCLGAAADLVAAANADADTANTERDEAEAEALRTALGVGATSSGAAGRSKRATKTAPKAKTMMIRGAAGALKDLEKSQKSRGRRTVLDSLDRTLLDLAGLYRDVLAHQLGATVDPVNPDAAAEISRLAAAATPERTLRRLEAVLATRDALAANPGLVAQLAVESLTLTLRDA